MRKTTMIKMALIMIASIMIIVVGSGIAVAIEANKDMSASSSSMLAFLYPDNMSSFEYDTKRSGNFLQRLRGSSKYDCRYRCSANDDCKAWTFYNLKSDSSVNYCYLKSSYGTPGSNNSYYWDAVSGYKGNLDEWDTTPFRPYYIKALPDGLIWFTVDSHNDSGKLHYADVGVIFSIDPNDPEDSFRAYYFYTHGPATFETFDWNPYDNSLWITDSKSSRIVTFSLDSHRFTGMYDLRGTFGPNDPRGIKVDYEGRYVWFTFNEGKLVGRLNIETEEKDRYPRNELLPDNANEITIDKNGTVWFTFGHNDYSGGNAGFGRIDPDDPNPRTALRLYTSDNYEALNETRLPFGIKVVKNKVWFIDKARFPNRLIKYDPVTDDITAFDLPESPHLDSHYFAVDENGLFWLTGYTAHSLVTFDPLTETVGRFDLAEGSYPMGITITSEGEIWWAESWDKGHGGFGRFIP